MKSLTTNCMIAVAALAAAAGSASAQVLKAEIPFTFRFGGAALTPGSYNVRVTHGEKARYVTLQSTDSRHVAVMLYYANDVPKALEARGTATIGFSCVGASCALTQIWQGPGSPTLQFKAPKSGADGEQRVAEVPLTRMAD